MQLPKHFANAIGDPDQWQLIIRSPGRINIIGEHTDYNGGLVLPAAIEQAIFFAVRPSQDGQWHLRALDLDEVVTFPSLPTAKTARTWVDYLIGVAGQFRQAGHVFSGLEIVFGGNLPVGAGVSSSAALEGGMAFICNELSGARLSRPQLAQLCQRSSNAFMGIPSGIMDQFASLNGRNGQAILLDCNSLEHEFISAQIPGYAFVLINSEVTHQLADSEYPVRVAECRRGLEILRQSYPELEALSHALPEMVEDCKDQMSEVVYRRCRYVAGESIRIRKAVEALKNQDATALGEQLNATHAGLRDDYEVSCPEVDFLQQFAVQFPAVAGSRIMGGGFGGCTINLVAENLVDDFIKVISAAYKAAWDITPRYFVSQISTGTEILNASRM